MMKVKERAEAQSGDTEINGGIVEEIEPCPSSLSNVAIWQCFKQLKDAIIKTDGSYSYRLTVSPEGITAALQLAKSNVIDVVVREDFKPDEWSISLQKRIIIKTIHSEGA